jgi:hypothetical protein
MTTGQIDAVDVFRDSMSGPTVGCTHKRMDRFQRSESGAMLHVGGYLRVLSRIWNEKS